MKTLFLLLITSALTAQTSQKLYFNKHLTTQIYGPEIALNSEKGILEFYECIKKNYPKDFKNSNYPEITKTKKFLKNKDANRSIESYSLNFKSGGENLQDRIELQKKYSKCIEPEQAEPFF